MTENQHQPLRRASKPVIVEQDYTIENRFPEPTRIAVRVVLHHLVDSIDAKSQAPSVLTP